jgi:hypothetical protein
MASNKSNKNKSNKNKSNKNKSNKNKSNKNNKTKQFFFNPDNPKLSYDVYIDKNPSDTISIKYTTYGDVKETIKKLERLYKTKKYPHKRIFQVAMILKVRLRVLQDIKKKHYKLALRYFEFLKKRTKLKTFSERKKFIFDLK